MNRHDLGLWHLSIILSPRWPFLMSRSIWGHEVKLPISVIWRRNTCLWVGLWVGFSSRTRKMTLEHRLLHRNRNKMKIWKCMVLRPNALKSSHFSHSKCYKTAFMKGITWNLVHTFFRVSSSTYIPFFFLILKFGGFFEKIKKNNEKNLKISKISKIPR